MMLSSATTMPRTKSRSQMADRIMCRTLSLALAVIIKIAIRRLGTIRDGKAQEMTTNPILSKVFEWGGYFAHAGQSDPDAQSIAKLHREARSFLERYDWCKEISEEYVGVIYPGIVGVFLFRLVPAREGVDEWVWVVVGDLPPAYITCEESPNPATALDAYVGAMLEWVDAVEKGAPTDQLIPVNVEPSKDNAARLRKRLNFLDEKILSGYADDLKAV